MIKRVRILRVLLLLAATAVGAFAWVKVSGWYDRFMQERAQNEIALSAPTMEAGAVFYLALDRPTGQNGALPAFGLWRLPPAADMASSVEDAMTDTDAPIETEEPVEAEEEAFYVLFVPGAARRTGLRVQFEGELSLDGQPLVSGQRLELAEGEHLLETLDGIWPFAVMYGSDLPCVFIEMSSGSLDAVHAQKGAMDLAYLSLIQADGLVEYTGSIWMRGRGNVSWVSRKKSYQIDLEEKTGLLGMDAADHWLLISNTLDDSLLRNQTAFTIAQAVGMPYTPASQQMELYVQGEYRGCYLLCEKVEVDDSRVNIPDMDEINRAAVREAGGIWEDAPALCDEGEWGKTGFQRYVQLDAEVSPGAGGYLFELDMIGRYLESGSPGFITQRGVGITIKSPSSATKQQVEYLAALYQQLEEILFLPEGETPDEELGRLIDLHSFAQKYLIEEITKNYDANVTSQYFYKFPDSISPKLYAGPVWDYDAGFERIELPEGFWANLDLRGYTLWQGVYRQPDFQQTMHEIFWQDFVPVTDRMIEGHWITNEAQQILASACMDGVRWQGEYDPERVSQEYLQEVTLVADFLDTRMAFLKEEWPAA